MLLHDGIGTWLAARRLHQSHFVWPQTGSAGAANRVSLSRAQLDALVLGLPWSRLGEGGIVSVVQLLDLGARLRPLGDAPARKLPARWFMAK